MTPLVAIALAQTAPGWTVERWGAEQGLPLEHVNRVEVDDDGVVWLATFDGLVRIDSDGVDILGPDDPLGPPSNRVVFLVRHPADGSLWLQTEDLLLQRRNGDQLRVLDHTPQTGMAVGLDSVYVAVDGGVLQLDDPVVLHPFPRQVTSLIAHRDGSVLLLDDEAGVWKGPPFERHAQAPSGGHLWTDREGRWGVWIHEEFAWLSPQGWVSVDAPPFPGLGAGPAPTEWGLLGGELYKGDVRVLVGDADIFDIAVSSDAVWVATVGEGLLRVRPTPVSMVGTAGNIQRLWRDGDAIWAQDHDAGWQLLEGDASPLPPPPGQAGCPEWTWRYHRDADDTLWVACNVHVFRMSSEGFESMPHPGGEEGPVWSTPEGDWFGGRGPAVVFREGAWSTPRTADGQVVKGVFALLQRPDEVWLAGHDGLYRVRPDGGAERLPGADELGPTRGLRDDGTWLWLATENRGLCVVPSRASDVRGARCMGANSGLSRATVHVTVADGLGHTWLSTNQGLGVVSTPVLNAWAEGGDEPVPLWLGLADGLRSSELNGFVGDQAVVADAGHFYLPSQRGTVRVDPDRFQPPEPPMVSFREEATHPLEKGHAPVQLSWWVPEQPWVEQVQYRVRVGDSPWSAPTQEPRLELASLGPGDTVIQVQARLAGPWGPVASTTVQRMPVLHERAVFPLLVGLLGALGGLGLVGWRSRSVRARAEELQDQVDQQTRDLAEQNRRLSVRADQLRARNEQIADQADRLQQLDVLKRQLIANLSHELRTPLSLVVAPIGQVHAGAQGDDRRKLGIALENAERLHELIGQLFELSRAQAGGIHLAARAVRVAEWCQGVLHRFEPMATQQDVQLALDAERPGPRVWMDPDLMDKVLSNLVNNALRYAPADSTITVSVREQDESVVLDVADQGPGIPEDERQQVFQRFVQSHPGRDHDGAGLGLALVQELVHLHGGEVGVVPSPVGARFRVTLPQGIGHLGPDDVSHDESLPAVAAPDTDDGPRRRVLLVEDHPQLRAFLAEALAEQFDVVVAVDGLDALEVLEQQAVDLIISDIMMPRMDGYALVRALQERAVETPVLFVSARHELDDVVDGLELADDYLAKPFQTPELLARASALLRRGGGPAQPVRPKFIVDLESQADAGLSDANFGVAQLAKALGMSPRTLQNRMQEHDLQKPVAWLRARRLDAARSMLTGAQVDTVAEAAAAVGLSPAYFSRAYRAHFGHSPKQDRRRGS